MGLPGGAERWRAAIARAERTAELTARTRAPGEAGVLRVAIWLLVEALLRAIRPALLVALIVAAAGFAWRGAETAANAGWSPLPGAMAGAEDPFNGAAAPGEAGLTAWSQRMEESLSPAPGQAPDLLLADAYLAAAPTFLPRETLAAAAGLGFENEAGLRALPAWLRERRLERARREALGRFAAQGYDPPALALLPPGVVRRRDRAIRLYGRLYEGLNAAIASGEGVVDLSRAPGFDGGEFRAAGASRSRLAARLVAAEQAGSIDVLGARVLRAAEAGGVMTQSLAAALEAGADGETGRRAAAAAGALARATSPLGSARIAGLARNPSDLERLAARARTEGLALLARADRLGPAAARSPLRAAAPAPPDAALEDFRLAGALLGFAALLVLVVVWSSGARGNLPGSGRGAVFDARLRRLLLGKKDQSI